MGLALVRAIERAELCQTLRQVGPDAPTLCAEWTASDIAAHLVVSERMAGFPLAVAYQLGRALPASVVQRAMPSLRSVGVRPLVRAKRRGWEHLLDRLAAGTPAGFRLRSAAPIRLVEEWIHHEDIRRACDLPTRQAAPELDEALWQAGLFLTRFAAFRLDRQGIEVVHLDGRTRRLGGTTDIRVKGSSGELLLYLSGRFSRADVEVTGDDTAIRSLSLAI